MSAEFSSASTRSDLHWLGSYRVAIMGAATLKGKEVAEVLGDRNFPRRDVKLLDDDESLGQLEAVGDEMAFVQTVRPEHFEGVDFAFLASEESFTRAHWKLAQKAGAAIIDLSFALEQEPGTRLRSPWVERELDQTIAPELEPAPVVVAHPAAIVLALLLLRAQKAGKVSRAVATLFEPASEHGRRGMDELHEQTVNLLSFHDMPKQVYDAQVTFNLLARYGPRSTPPLASVEHRVLDHYRRLTGDNAPTPSMMMVQAPVFHAHAFSIFVEMENATSLADMEQSLAGDHVQVVGASDEAPSNVNAAGQADILLTLRRDTTHENGFWLWAVADNLRIAASTAVESAETMAASRPQGNIQ